MLKTILVPLDGSPLAERALSLATALSIPTAAHLVLVRVFPTEPADDGYLEQTAADLRNRGFRVHTAAVSGEHVARAIQRAAQQHQADLIVMTTHGRSGPARWVLGSVAETLVKCSQVPILVQRAWDPGRRSILLGNRPRVLVTLDGSRFAEAALPVALSLADDLGAEIVLVRVDSRSPEVLIPAEVEEAEEEEHTATYRPLAAIEEYLDGVAARLRREWPALTINTRVERGDPSTAIVAATSDLGAAFVVMATHGRTGFERVAVGSVAHRVLQHGRAPLVLVRPALAAAPIPI